MKILLELFLAFARIGALTFGGGLAMLPMLKYELCEKRDWVTEDEIMDYYAIGQCTPGIIAVNTATFVGYKKKGVTGGIIATIGMVTPSIIIILLVATVLNVFMGNEILSHALSGIRAAACALIASTVVTLAKKGITDINRVGLYGLTYKENVDDVRESPTLQLLESQKRHLANGLKVYDPFIKKEMVDNQYYDLDEFLNDIDLVVIMVKHNEIIENMDKLSGKVILDCHNICKLEGTYHI